MCDLFFYSNSQQAFVECNGDLFLKNTFCLYADFVPSTATKGREAFKWPELQSSPEYLQKCLKQCQ